MILSPLWDHENRSAAPLAAMGPSGISHTFDALAANGSTPSLDLRSRGGYLPSKHTVQTVVVGSPSAATGAIEGSLDGSTWDTLAGSIDLTTTHFTNLTDKVYNFIRLTLSGLTGGTSPTVTVFYAGAP